MPQVAKESTFDLRAGVSADQLAALKSEQGGEGNEETLAALLAEVEISFTRAADRIRALATANLETPRFVGRKQLPTSIGGALIHVADHTQRHTGQVVTTAKLLKAARVDTPSGGVHGLS